MMKKFLSTSLLTLALAGASLSAPTVQVTVDQQTLNFDQPPVMQDGRVLVPLRGIFESLGADVLYLPADRSIKATRGQTQVQLQLGSRSAMVNGQTKYLDVPAASYGGRTMVPLRFISEALGADVDWQAATRTVAITSTNMGSPQPPTSQNPEPPAQQESRLEIQSVIHSATGVLRPGDRLQVVMTGDRDGQAYFDVQGAFNNVPMREVRPGRYEGTVTVPDGVDVRRATVVGRLIGPGGQESQMEASRAITFGASRDNNPGQYPGNQYSLLPLPNSTVNQARPEIQAQFDRPLRQNSVRVVLDNQDMTSLAQVYQRQVRLTPPNNLYPGNHQVIIDAYDQRGNSMRQQWGFNVNTNGGYGVDTIQLFNLNDGMTVDRIFSVQGQTAPFANVRVTAQPNRDLIPGFLGVRGRRIEMTGVADANGRFNLRMDASGLPSNTVLEMTIESTDPSGRAQVPAHLNVTLR